MSRALDARTVGAYTWAYLHFGSILPVRVPHAAWRQESGDGGLARVVGGLLGWIASVTPLIVVNIFGALGVLSWDDAFVVSAVALIAGPILGGLVAGYVAGHPDRASASGAREAAWPAD